jgi:methylthioxylose transferase
MGIQRAAPREQHRKEDEAAHVRQPGTAPDDGSRNSAPAAGAMGRSAGRANGAGEGAAPSPGGAKGPPPYAAAVRRGPERAVVAGVAVAVAAVVAYGLVVHARYGRLGTASPPFVSGWAPAVAPNAVAIAVVVLGLVVVLAPRAISRPRSAIAFAAALTVAAAASALAVNAARTGPRAWSAVFTPGRSFEAANEYLPSLAAAGQGVHFLLDRFDLLVASLAPNAGAHPPGLLVLLHATGIATPNALAALCIAAAAALPALTYGLARGVLDDEPRARTAALLAALSPDVLLFATTSADAVYAALATAAAWGLAARTTRARTAGAGLLALGSLFSWALPAIAAWAVVHAARRDGRRRALNLAALCAAALLALHGALAVAYGWDPLAALRATERLYRNSLASIRPYRYWVLGSPVAWLVTLGLPIAAGLVAATARRRPAAVALAVVVAIAAAGGFTKAETERIWLFLTPLAAVAAADVLPPRALKPVLAALAAQALAWQLLFNTVW